MCVDFDLWKCKILRNDVIFLTITPKYCDAKKSAGRLFIKRPTLNLNLNLNLNFILHIIIFSSEMCDRFLAHQITKRILELHLLDEEVVFRI